MKFDLIDLAAEWQQLRLVVVIHGETRESMILENPYGPGVRRVKKLGYAVSALSAMIVDSLLVSICVCLGGNPSDNLCSTRLGGVIAFGERIDGFLV